MRNTQKTCLFEGKNIKKKNKKDTASIDRMEYDITVQISDLQDGFCACMCACTVEI